MIFNEFLYFFIFSIFPHFLYFLLSSTIGGALPGEARRFPVPVSATEPACTRGHSAPGAGAVAEGDAKNKLADFLRKRPDTRAYHLALRP